MLERYSGTDMWSLSGPYMYSQSKTPFQHDNAEANIGSETDRGFILKQDMG